MAIAFAQASSLSLAATVTAQPSTAMATQVAGSIFYALVIAQGAAGATVPTITDNKGNNTAWAAAAIGAQLTNTNTEYVWRFQIPNGVGGAGHIITATFGASVGTIMVTLAEATGGATSAALDQSNTGPTGASVGPLSSGSITVAPPANSELLLSVILGHSSSTNLAFAEANGFTIQAFQEAFATSALQWALASKVVSAANPYNASWSWGGANIFVCSCIDSFKGLASAGGTTPNVSGSKVSAGFVSGLHISGSKVSLVKLP